MNCRYDQRVMDIDQKERLARRGSMDKVACAIRLRAARYAAGLEQQDLAQHGGVSKAALSNVEGALSFPSRDVVLYLFKAHRIDFNFVWTGEFAQLPGDVQDRLFPALERATYEWEQRESLGQTQSKTKAAPPKN